MFNPFGYRADQNRQDTYIPGWLRTPPGTVVPHAGYPYGYVLPVTTNEPDPNERTEEKLEGQLLELANELTDHPAPPLLDDPAPDFELPGYVDSRWQTVSLADYRGRWAVLMFYTGDFTFVCPTELNEVGRRYDEFEQLQANVIAISTDSVWSHRAFHMTSLQSVRFPLLADRSHQVSLAYGVLNRETGASRRATIIVDPEGKIQFYAVYPADVGRSIDEMLRTLSALQFARQTGQLTPAGWRRGDQGIHPE